MAAALDALAALPPWDAAGFFQQVTEVNFPTAANGDQLCAADPNRVALVFGTTAMSGSYVSLVKGGMAIKGMQISTSLPPLVLLFKDVGPLVQQAFFLSTAFGTANVSVYAIALYRWPKAGDTGKRPPHAYSTLAE